MQKERNRDSGSRGLPRSYTHAAIDTAKVQRVERDGVFEREEQPDDLRQVCESEIQVWEGYYVDTVGRNKAAIEKYIRNQLIEDKNEEQLVMKELFDPFTGEPAKKDR